MRKYIESICEHCGDVYKTRNDEYKRKYEKNHQKKLCPQCSSLNFDGFIDTKGYVIKHWRTFPREKWEILKKMCKNNGQIKEHRALMAIFLNRPLMDNEIIHHKNGIKTDNRIENLEIISASEHQVFHMTELANANKKLQEENIRLREEISCLSEKLKQKVE